MPRREPDGDATLHDLFPPVLGRQGHPGDVINPRPPTEEALLMSFPGYTIFRPRARAPGLGPRCRDASLGGTPASLTLSGGSPIG